MQRNLPDTIRQYCARSISGYVGRSSSSAQMQPTQPIRAEQQHAREAKRQAIRDRQIRRVIAGLILVPLIVVAKAGR